ncbi:MAG TPA: flavin reductase family protein [Thermodesulfobacteriota bacterium]|nr:flavin reductase family protein [Thermodesulfobacteriota bacterium]
MDKIKIDNNAFVYPMPMVLAGAMVGDKPNFMAVGWVARVNFQPPMIGIALGKTHYTNEGIHKNQAFSVNIPGMDLIEKVDFCGLVTGKKTDKSRTFDVFYRELKNAPMIRECPLCMECRVVQGVDLPSNTLFIGQIMGAYAEERFLTDGQPDILKINPFTLTMPDNQYWTVGKLAGKAWGIGKNWRGPKR